MWVLAEPRRSRPVADLLPSVGEDAAVDAGGVGVVDADLITAMKDVATDYMIQAMMTLAPCGAWSPEVDYPFHLESITNFRELPRYLKALLVLRRELNKE